MRLNIGLALVCVLLLLLMESVTGRIPANDGRGWDGMDYSAMLGQLNLGTVNTALRPLVVVANRPAARLLGNPVTAFRVMNALYIAIVGFTVCLLFDRYSGDAAAKTVLVLNLFISIALVKYTAFYPVLIDVGAHAAIVVALWAMVSGRRVAAGVAAAAAVLAREFGIATVAFGIVRDLRQRVPLRQVVMTYLPAIAVFVGWRVLITTTWSFRGASEPLGLQRLLLNLDYFADPLFAGLFVYFALTIFGGVSLLVAARAGTALAALRREPEWAVYAAMVLAAAAMGDADMWRYLAYLLPVVVVLAAACVRQLQRPGRRLMAAALVCMATIVTQRPLQTIDVQAYFLDWFPYYIAKGTNLPLIDQVPSLWPIWGWRFLIAAGFLWLFTAVIPDAHRA